MTITVTAETSIEVPLDKAWEKLSDISVAHRYVPGLVKTEIVTDQRTGIGASRYVYRSEKSYIQETVEEWQDGEGFLIRLHKGDKRPAPFQKASFRYALSAQGPDSTLFTAQMHYTMPWGRFGQWLGSKMAGYVQSTITDVALSMKLYYETGQPTTSHALKAYKAKVLA